MLRRRHARALAPSQKVPRATLFAPASEQKEVAPDRSSLDDGAKRPDAEALELACRSKKTRGPPFEGRRPGKRRRGRHSAPCGQGSWRRRQPSERAQARSNAATPVRNQPARGRDDRRPRRPARASTAWYERPWPGIPELPTAFALGPVVGSKVGARFGTGGCPMPTLLRSVTLAVLALASGAVAAHGGGLNAEGCHNDRKHGGYHCHRGAASRPPPAQNFAPASGFGNALDDASGGSAYRNCTASLAGAS